MVSKRIRSKERDAIIQSLKSGVTPKIGIQHIQVGRSKVSVRPTTPSNTIFCI